MSETYWQVEKCRFWIQNRMQFWNKFLDPRSRWRGKEDKVWYARTGQLRLRIGIGGELL